MTGYVRRDRISCACPHPWSFAYMPAHAQICALRAARFILYFYTVKTEKLKCRHSGMNGPKNAHPPCLLTIVVVLANEGDETGLLDFVIKLLGDI
jgi:hypothetical protein